MDGNIKGSNEKIIGQGTINMTQCSKCLNAGTCKNKKRIGKILVLMGEGGIPLARCIYFSRN